jgi:hypothetical protein
VEIDDRPERIKTREQTYMELMVEMIKDPSSKNSLNKLTYGKKQVLEHTHTLN